MRFVVISVKVEICVERVHQKAALRDCFLKNAWFVFKGRT